MFKSKQDIKGLLKLLLLLKATFFGVVARLEGIINVSKKSRADLKRLSSCGENFK